MLPPDGYSPQQQPLPTPEELEAAHQTIRIYQRQDPAFFTRPNFFQQRLFHALRDPKPGSLTVVLALKPNRVGGSYGLVNLWNALMFGTENVFLQGSPFGAKWPFMKAARIVSTAENLGDVGPIQTAMRKIFPVGKYEQGRGVGKGYYSAGTTATGWAWDAMSFGQDALTAAGANKGLILISEPPPRALFTECITRLSGNGVLVVECVQLDLAPWLDEMAEDAGGRPVPVPMHRQGPDQRLIQCEDPRPDSLRFGSLKLDGKVVGEIRVVRGDVEDACASHCNGHMAHSAIEAMVAAWPAEEREARRRGTPMKLSGRIYPQWGDAHELDEVPDWHAEQWDKGQVRIATVLDPADRRPWAMTWFALYPNEDVIAFAEWPPFDYYECKASPVTDLEDYRNVILESEATLGRPVDLRLIDPLFGSTPGKGNARTLIKMLAGPCRDCLRKAGAAEYDDLDDRSLAFQQAEERCSHRLAYSKGVAYDGSVRDGHILVRAALGDPLKGIRPKLYAMRATCPNFCKGMRRYAWKENTREGAALSEKPELVYKDFCDLVRLGYLKKFEKWPEQAPPPPKIVPGAWPIRATPLPPAGPRSYSERPKYR